MQIDDKLVERLLYEEESSELDFKRKQYRFIGADDEDKSELLKDILAFANSWRRSDAFILIGVEEVKGGRSTIVGLDQDLDEAQIQQFVNAKTQRPLSFSYRVVSVDQDRVGVIHILLQDRSLYLKKDFGKLKKSVVYVRRGSSTAEAEPDEIARMGSDAALVTRLEPNLSISLGDTKKRRLFGTEIRIEIVNLCTPPNGRSPIIEEREVTILILAHIGKSTLIITEISLSKFVLQSKCGVSTLQLKILEKLSRKEFWLSSKYLILRVLSF